MTTKTGMADALWDELKNIKLDLYGLSGQSVESLYDRLPLDPNQLHLRLKNQGATASITVLEEALNPGHPDNHKYEITTAERGLLVISKKIDLSDVIKRFDDKKLEEAMAAAAAKKKSAP